MEINTDIENSSIAQAIESMPTERELDEYKDKLDITDKELGNWDVVVDLGSGTAQEFARDYAAAGYGGKVISVDPNLGVPWSIEQTRYLPEEHEHRLKGRNNFAKGTMAGLSQELPLKNSSVDAVLALYSMPKWVEDENDIKRSISEISRVLVPGGTARIFPVHETKNKRVVQEALNELNNVDYVFTEKEDVGGEKKYLLSFVKK